jgi:hypothetical protein
MLLLVGHVAFPGLATSASAAVSLQLSSPITGNLPFTVGLVFKQGEMTGTPVLDIPNQQVIVKRRWNDNSVKHAIASGLIALSANTPQTVTVLSGVAPTGTLTAGDIQAANPQASVSLGIYGTVNLSSLLGTPLRTWISGPQMVEAHYRANVGNDQTLVVWFHVRYYSDGHVWIRTIVENGYLDVTTADKSYVPTVIIGGTTVYNNGGAVLTQYAHTRWSSDGWIGGDPQVTPKHSTQSIIDAKFVPNYLMQSPSSAALDALYQAYNPMENGGWTQTMGDTGFQPQIGLLTLWDSLYITSGADARAYRSVIANAKALNSYGIVWNDSATQLPTTPSGRPTWTVDGPEMGGETAIGAGPLTWDLAHHGSAGYLAYLITGDYLFLETMEDQAAASYLLNSSGYGSGTSRILQQQTRAVAWANRSIGQLAAVGPLDSIVADYQSLLANNVAYWNTQANLPNQNPLGYLYSYEIGSYPGTGNIAPWQQHFWVQTFGFLGDIEPLSDPAQLTSLRGWLYRSIVGLLGSVGPGVYCYTKASNYTIQIAPSNSSAPTTWYTSWGQVYQGTFGSQNTSCGTTLEGSSGSDPAAAATGYWGNLMPAIAYAVDHGAAGSSAAWSRLTSATNWSTILSSGFADTPIWGIIPRTSASGVPAAPTGLRVQ